MSNFGLEEFQPPEFEGYGPKTSKNVSEDISNEVRESPDAPLVEELVSNDKLEKKIVFPTVAKIEFVRPKQQEKLVRKLVKYAKMYSFDHVHADFNYHQRERVLFGNNYTMVNYNYSTKKAYPSAYRIMASREVLMKTSLRPLNNARLVNTAHPKTTVYSARPMSCFSKSAQSTVKRPNSAVVNAVRANQVNVVKASACCVWKPTKLNSASITLKRHSYVDARGRSKNLIEDMLPLGWEPKEGKLLVKELLKQMCDKKNTILFIDTGCFVLSPDFKLADKSQVLLKVPRKNNMYSVDMKNIVPKECLTYLVAKATLDKSMLFKTYVKSKDLDLWHVITNGDFQPVVQNPETKLDEVIPFEKQIDDLKKRLAKNNEAKMVIYNALLRKEYERIFMCNTAKEIWKTFLITHQGNSQVKDNKIDLLVQQYEQFIISKDESIDSAFARFNTIITSLKALDEVKAKVERKSIALKAKNRISDDDVFDFRYQDKEDSWSNSSKEDDEKVKDETCLVAHASSEVCSESSYFSDENSSIDDLPLDNEYDKLCKM
ncbi:hypothetical protein Tco_0956422 [Tanacetum coccineum]